MTILKDNWFLQPVFDFEYKSYQVLGYAQYLNSHFDNWRFFPYIDSLQKRLAELSAYRDAKSNMEEKLHRDIASIDLKNKKIIKVPVEDKTGILDEIQHTLEFAQKQLKTCYSHAHAEFESVKKEVQITPIGITGPNSSQGLILFRKPKQMRIYAYSLRMVVRPDGADKYKDLKTNYLKAISVGIFPDFHQIKWNIIQNAAMEVGTNAYLVDCNLDLPHFETVMPIVKNYLIERAQ